MLRNLSKHYLFICCKQSSSTHFCHYLATAFVTDVLAGSNPMRWAQKRKAPIAGSLSNQWWAMRDVRVRLRRPHPLRRFAPRVLRWKTLRVSSAPHPWRVRIPPPTPYLLVRDSKQKSSLSWELSQSKWRRRRDSNPRDLIQAKRFSRPPHSTTLPPLRVG